MEALALLVFLAADTDDAAMRKEMQKLEGIWRVTSAEVDGKKLAKNLPIETVVFKSGKIDPERKGTLTLVYMLELAKNPKEIQAERAGSKKDKLLGIYQLDDDALRLCIGPIAQAPTEFKSDAKTKVFVLELQRVKK